MPMPQKPIPSHAAAIGGASVSTRSAVNEILQSTDMILHAFRQGRQELHQSVEGALMEFKRMREGATNRTRASLKNYADDLHATVKARIMEIAAARRKLASQRARQQAAARKGLAESEQRHMEELAAEREHATKSQRESLKDYTEDLHQSVEHLRAEVQQKLGLAEPRHQALRPQARTPRAKGPEQRAMPLQKKHLKHDGAPVSAGEDEKSARAKPAKRASSGKRQAD